MTTIDVIVAHCHPSRGIASGFVITPKTVHHVSHYPGDGWFCLTCGRGRRCANIDVFKEVVPANVIETAAAGLNRAVVVTVAGRVRLPNGRTGTIVKALKKRGIDGAMIQADDETLMPQWFPARVLELVTTDE